MFLCTLIVLFFSVGAFAQSSEFHLKAVRVSDGTVLGPVYINNSIATLNVTGAAIPTFFITANNSLERLTTSLDTRAFVDFLSDSSSGTGCTDFGDITFNVTSENTCAEETPFQLLENGTLKFGTGGTFLVCGGASVSTIGYTKSSTSGLGCDAITLMAISKPSEFHLEAVRVSDNAVLGLVYVNDTVATLNVTADHAPSFSLFGNETLVLVSPDILIHKAFVNFLPGPSSSACTTAGTITFNVFTGNTCAESSPFQLLDNVTLTFGSGGTFLVCGGASVSTIAYTTSGVSGLGCDAIRLLAL